MDVLSKEFKEQIASELKILDLSESNMTNISKQHYYHTLFIEYKKEFLKLKRSMDTQYQELYHYYKFEFEYNLTSKEIEIYLKANKKYKILNRAIQMKELEMEVLEDVIKLFVGRSFSIKNALEINKLQG